MSRKFLLVFFVWALITFVNSSSGQVDGYWEEIPGLNGPVDKIVSDGAG